MVSSNNSSSENYSHYSYGIYNASTGVIEVSRRNS